MKKRAIKKIDVYKTYDQEEEEHTFSAVATLFDNNKKVLKSSKDIKDLIPSLKIALSTYNINTMSTYNISYNDRQALCSLNILIYVHFSGTGHA